MIFILIYIYIYIYIYYSTTTKKIISEKDLFYYKKNQTLTIILEYADEEDIQSNVIMKKIIKKYYLYLFK